MSYGIEQERAAGALASLITHHRGPPDPAIAAAVLRIREQLRAAVLERVEILGEGTHENHQARPCLEAMGGQGIHLLHRIVRETPYDPRLREQHSPVQVLTEQHPAAHVQAWATAARAVTIGNHELTTTADPAWSYRPAASWYLLADTAELVEAFVVLDNPLDRAGLLDDHTRPEQSWNLRGRRAIAATVAREASWAGTDPTPDRATSSATMRAGDGVQLVRDLETFGLAQLRLADFVHTKNKWDAGYDPHQELSLGLGRALALSQAKINRQLALACHEHPELAGPAARFAQRFEHLVKIRETSARFRDLVAKPPPTRILSQQVEISRALDSTLARLTRADPGLVQQIDTATHTAGAELARAIHRQVTRKDSPYAHYDTEGDQVAVGADRKHAFPQACLALVVSHAPLTRWSEPISRRALRAALHNSPTQIGGARPSRMNTAHRRDLER